MEKFTRNYYAPVRVTRREKGKLKNLITSRNICKDLSAIKFFLQIKSPFVHFGHFVANFLLHNVVLNHPTSSAFNDGLKNEMSSRRELRRIWITTAFYNYSFAMILMTRLKCVKIGPMSNQQAIYQSNKNSFVDDA